MSIERTAPRGWDIANLEDVVSILDSKRVPVNAKERETRFGSVPYYGATGQVGWIDGYLFDEELVLLGEDGAPFLEAAKKKAYIIRGKSWVNNHAHVLKARSDIPNAYIKYYLDIVDYHEFVTGTTRLKLNQAAMRRIPVPIAPPAQRNRIVAEIEKQFSRLDEAVANLKRVKANLKRYKSAVLKAAVEGKLTEDWREQHPDVELASKRIELILAERRAKWNGRGKYKEPTAPDTSDLPELPDRWGWATMPQLGELNRGKSKHRPRNDLKLFGGPYPFIQTGDVKRSGGFVRSHSQTYNESGLAQSRLWPVGTLCITIAANIAETGILTYSACFPDSVVGFVFDSDPVTVRFIDLFFRTEREEIARFAPATAQKNINLEILSAVAVPIPPFEEQKEIVAEVERRLSVIEELEAAAQANLTRADRLRQSILQQAFSGRLLSASTHSPSLKTSKDTVAETSSFGSYIR